MKEYLDKDVLVNCVEWEMPFGKFEGRKLCDLPIFYLEWFARENAFPKGKLGMAMRTVYEVKLNGLEEIFIKLRKQKG